METLRAQLGARNVTLEIADTSTGANVVGMRLSYPIAIWVIGVVADRVSGEFNFDETLSVDALLVCCVCLDHNKKTSQSQHKWNITQVPDSKPKLTTLVSP